MNLVWLRKKKIYARPKFASLLAITLISGLLVSIPLPANAAACNPTSTTASNGDTILTFSTVGTCDWTVPPTVTGIELLIIAGGGGGGWGAGGGGGGGQVISVANLSVTPGTSIAITVGTAGGYGYTSTTNGRVGSSSAVTIASNSITATGGNYGMTCSFSWFGTCLTPSKIGGAAIAAIGVGTKLQNIGGGNGGNGNPTSSSTSGAAGGKGFSASITGTLANYGNGGGGGGYFSSGISERNYGAGGAGGAWDASGKSGVQGVVYIRESSYIPTNTSTVTPTKTNTATRTLSATQTSTSTRTATSTNTNTATHTNTATNTNTATRTSTPTNTNTATRTSTKTQTPIIAVPTQLPPANSDHGQVITWGDSSPFTLGQIPRNGNNNITQIAIGAHHALALTTSGTIIGWGSNLKGELTIPPLTNIIQISVGLNHSAVLKSDGTVHLWGNSTSTTAPVNGRLSGITQIASGDNYTALLGNDGKVFVYGNHTQPPFVNKYIVAIAAGSDSVLALGNDGAVYRWGASTSVPTRVAGSVMRIFASGNLYGALRSDGELTLWGSAVNNLTLNGNALSISSATPGCPCIKIPSMDGLRAIHLTKWGVLLLRRSRQFQAFPYQGYAIPSSVPNDSIQISTNPNHALGIAIAPITSQLSSPTITPATALTLHFPQELNTPGYLRIWGNYAPISETLPVTTTDLFLQVVAGYRHIAVLRTNGGVVAWGDNRYGQSSVPDGLEDPLPITDSARVIALAAGANHTIALRANGTIVAWGNNDAGQIDTPTNVNTVTQVVAGVQHSAALLADGSVRSWGANTAGQLTQPALGGVAKIAAGGWHTIALRRDNTVIAWGLNDMGQTTLGNYTNVIDIAASAKNSILLLATGQIIVVGQNDYQQRTPPTGYFQRIGAGAFHLLAISDHKQLVGWGLNADEQTTIPSDLFHPFQMTGGMNFSAALVQQLQTPTATSHALVPTAPDLPKIPTAIVQPSHAQFMEINNAGLAPITSFNGSDIALTTGFTATLDSTGTIITNRRSDAPLCDIPSAFRSTKYYHVALGEYGMLLGLDRTVKAWATGQSCPVDITSTIPSAFQRYVAEIAVRGTHMMILTIDGRIWSNQFGVLQITGIKHIAAGRNFASVLLNNGTIRIFATNNTNSVLSIPTTATAITDIAAGDYHMLALRNNGQIVAWGDIRNDYGQSDIPYAATLGNIVAISAGERQSMVLLRTGKVVAWGDYPANVTDNLDTINRNHYVTGIATGDRRIFTMIDNTLAQTPTVTMVPTASAVIIPIMTPRSKSADFIANQIAWYTMSNFGEPQQFAGSNPSASFRCGTPRTCPRQGIDTGLTDNTTTFPVLTFDEVSGDELVANQNTTLNAIPFTIRATFRRASLNRADVLLSIGTPGSIRKYLVLGIDKENRPYCSFFGDDLRSTTWYVDTEWHSYACSYDPTTRIRTLWRDTQIIGQDISKGAFTPPAAPLIIARRYDNMKGLNGDIERASIFDHVLSQSEHADVDSIIPTTKLTELQANTQLLSVSPNGGTSNCGPKNGGCPDFELPSLRNLVSDHNGAAAIFSTPDTIQIDTPLPSSFTIAYWASLPNPITNKNYVVTKANSNGQGIYMGFDRVGGNTAPFCAMVTINGSTPTTTNLSSASIDNNWHHYACSYERITNTVAFYIDSQLISTNTLTLSNGAQFPVITQPMYVGYNPNTVQSFSPGGLTGVIDDFMMSDSALSVYAIAQMYNNTNPATTVPIPVATACPGSSCPNATPTITFSITPTASVTASVAPSRKALVATPSETMPKITPYTITATRTRTKTSTATATRTRTKTSTTVPSATPFLSPTYTPTITRTPFYLTLTMLARRSPTYRAQTLTAAVTSHTVTVTRTITKTNTAYPVPATNTKTATAYPTP